MAPAISKWVMNSPCRQRAMVGLSPGSTPLNSQACTRLSSSTARVSHWMRRVLSCEISACTALCSTTVRAQLRVTQARGDVAAGRVGWGVPGSAEEGSEESTKQPWAQIGAIAWPSAVATPT